MGPMPPSPTRDRGIDAARGVAVLSMFVAHFAPGPGSIVEITDHLTAPLFAFLIGWGAVLGRDRPGAVPSTLVRAATLTALGLGLEQVGAQIVIVLVWLGALTLVAALLVRMPSAAVAASAAACLLLSSSLDRWGDARTTAWRTADVLAGGDGQGVVPRLYELSVSGPYYRLTTLALMAAVAVLLARADGSRARLLTGVIAAVIAAVLQGAELAGVVAVVPYTTTYQAQVFALALAVTTVQVVRLLVDAAPRLADLLAPLGAMTLSVYTVQILVSAWWVHDGRHLSDNSWGVLASVTAMSFALAWGWPRVVRIEPWSRGPLEGVERTASALLARGTRAISA